MVATADSHIGEMGQASTLAHGDSFKEFFKRITARQAYLCPADLTLPRLKEETSLRIRRLFDKAAWIHGKDSLTMQTVNAILDGIIRRVAHERSSVPGSTRWLLRMAIEMLSGSGIPGSLYPRYQNGLADQIARLMDGAEAAVKCGIECSECWRRSRKGAVDGSEQEHYSCVVRLCPQ